MQQGGKFGGGVYSSPPMPPDHASFYDGSQPYGSSPGSAPSAPVYAQAPPSYYQHNAASTNLSVSPYNSHSNSSLSQQLPAHSHTGYSDANPPPSLVDQSPPPAAQGNSYASSYAPVVPAYPPLGSSYDKSSEIGSGSFDLPVPSHSYSQGNAGYGMAAPQASAGYESFSQGNGGYGSQGEQGYGGGAMYEQGYGNSRYGVSYSENYGAGGGDRDYDNAGFQDVYAYDGGGVEPYGARGNGRISWTGDDAGSVIGESVGSIPKVARATPKTDGSTDSGGVQKFRVKLLPETRSTDSIKDVLCQIGLDGVRMVDPSTSRTLRIYPLDTISKWEVKEPSVFTFWAKSAVDVDQRIIQLKSNNYTTTAILDTLTAACVQLCEMVKDGANDGSNLTAGAGTTADSSALRKGSVLDWVALRPRAATVEEKQHWVPDEAVTKCNSCQTEFGAFLRRHHCRNCGDIFCDKCTRGRIALNTDDDSQVVRVCDRCLGIRFEVEKDCVIDGSQAEVTQRLENMNKANLKVAVPQRTHEDLAKKLQEELERNIAGRKPVSNRPASNGSASSGQTSVLNCSKCGAITLVTGNSRGCSNCGADSGKLSSVSEKTTGAYNASTGLHGPPHLWSNDVSTSDRAVPKTREVACPTCTVHLQVQVPNFGTETVECGVCQHPFLVAA